MTKSKHAINMSPKPSVSVVGSNTKVKGAKTRKPYEEIGVLFNGNEIKIRVPKATSKPTNKSQMLLQRCNCDHDSNCSETCGFPPADSEFENEGMCSENVDDHCGTKAMCSICNVTPKDAPKGVKAHKVLHPNKDVFILKIGKETDEPNRTGNIEVELVTPRAPGKVKPAHHCIKQVQCETDDFPCCIPCRMCKPSPKAKTRKKVRCN